ncbi:penicillin-binding protein 2 [Chitiniphilus purpureus]|uniref:Peptidoglycan D,D-transpeptidase MrdA n=1 Tax=Chitiniphilus purpureus TaxID=2981137 RepID=A0ABY6DL80_9NEIS|nr:penicillin-binding protein 2 [Chitiniphilus sp. CD1]UXY15119.1 penicillin-binding protein 2 [Chitiniphilus sp. CD1]
MSRRPMFGAPPRGKTRRNSSNELKNGRAERSAYELRLVTAVLFVLILFGVLLARFVWLQGIQHDKYMTLAEANRISLVPVPPSRGIIRDRNGEILAHNYSAYTLEVVPARIADLDTLITELNQIVPITPKDRRRFKKLQEESKEFESLPIKTRLTDAEVARFAASSYRFPGVEIKARLFRHYPQGEVGSHLVGYIGRINDRDLTELEKNGMLANYRGSEHIGKIGIEASYERYLHGVTGFEEVEIDANGRAVRTLRRVSPRPGHDLMLSVDIRLQRVVETLFAGRRGALVAIDPANGGVLAFVSMPGFDPNLFVDGIDPQSWKDLNESPDKPLLNRALRGEYPPGSTFKPFMAMAALEGDFPLVRQTIADPGYFLFGGHRFRDSKAGGHGSMNFDRSLTVSSDTYYYQLAVQMGIDYIADFMAGLDFGRQTGIDLPGERPGVLPSPEWKRKRFRNPAQQKWYAGETVSIGIGQGYNSYTPLQMAHAMATLTNHGVAYRPHVVADIVDPNTGTRVPVAPRPERVLPWQRGNTERVLRGLASVITSGTAASVFRNAGYTAGGKTGTAQVFSLRGAKYSAHSIHERLRDHSWFIAFAPLEQPRIALAVIVENGGWGATAAAPIARKALDYYLLGKEPEPVAPEAAPAPSPEPHSD